MSKVKDMDLAEEGKKLLDWAVSNMPVLASIRERFKKEKPLSGIRVGVALHLEKKTGILLETLVAGGAEVSAASCNPLTTDDRIAAALAAGVYDVPIDIDNNVARISLESQGIMLDKLTVEQKEYRQNWKEGT